MRSLLPLLFWVVFIWQWRKWKRRIRATLSVSWEALFPSTPLPTPLPIPLPAPISVPGVHPPPSSVTRSLITGEIIADPILSAHPVDPRKIHPADEMLLLLDDDDNGD